MNFVDQIVLNIKGYAMYMVKKHKEFEYLSMSLKFISFKEIHFRNFY